jgi:hypothetical protein
MARGYMKKMAELYPDEEFNKIYNNDDDSDVIDYKPGANNDEIIDYVPKK